MTKLDLAKYVISDLKIFETCLPERYSHCFIVSFYAACSVRQECNNRQTHEISNT